MEEVLTIHIFGAKVNDKCFMIFSVRPIFFPLELHLTSRNTLFFQLSRVPRRQTAARGK